jgi:hypothetical protein
MNAWLWVANPEKKWTGVPGTNLTPWDALDQYLGLNVGCTYVYWATPDFYTQIKVGDPAYIWLSGGRGIIAAGKVAEMPPDKYRPGRNEHEFAHPARLRAPGWNEDKATSEWKIGISIDRKHLWGCADPLPVPQAQNLFTHPGPSGKNTIFGLDDGQHQRILDAIAQRLRG